MLGKVISISNKQKYTPEFLSLLERHENSWALAANSDLSDYRKTYFRQSGQVDISELLELAKGWEASDQFQERGKTADHILWESMFDELIEANCGIFLSKDVVALTSLPERLYPFLYSEPGTNSDRVISPQNLQLVLYVDRIEGRTKGLGFYTSVEELDLTRTVVDSLIKRIVDSLSSKIQQAGGDLNLESKKLILSRVLLIREIVKASDYKDMAYFENDLGPFYSVCTGPVEGRDSELENALKEIEKHKDSGQRDIIFDLLSTKNLDGIWNRLQDRKTSPLLETLVRRGDLDTLSNCLEANKDTVDAQGWSSPYYKSVKLLSAAPNLEIKFRLLREYGSYIAYPEVEELKFLASQWKEIHDQRILNGPPLTPKEKDVLLAKAALKKNKPQVYALISQGANPFRSNAEHLDIERSDWTIYQGAYFERLDSSSAIWGLNAKKVYENLKSGRVSLGCIEYGALLYMAVSQNDEDFITYLLTRVPVYMISQAPSDVVRPINPDYSVRLFDLMQKVSLSTKSQGRVREFVLMSIQKSYLRLFESICKSAQLSQVDKYFNLTPDYYRQSGVGKYYDLLSQYYQNTDAYTEKLKQYLEKFNKMDSWYSILLPKMINLEAVELLRYCLSRGIYSIDSVLARFKRIKLESQVKVVEFLIKNRLIGVGGVYMSPDRFTDAHRLTYLKERKIFFDTGGGNLNQTRATLRGRTEANNSGIRGIDYKDPSLQSLNERLRFNQKVCINNVLFPDHPLNEQQKAMFQALEPTESLYLQLVKRKSNPTLNQEVPIGDQELQVARYSDYFSGQYSPVGYSYITSPRYRAFAVYFLASLGSAENEKQLPFLPPEIKCLILDMVYEKSVHKEFESITIDVSEKKQVKALPSPNKRERKESSLESGSSASKKSKKTKPDVKKPSGTKPRKRQGG